MNINTLIHRFEGLEIDTNVLIDKVLYANIEMIYANKDAAKWSIVQIFEHLRIAEKQTLKVIANNIENNDNFKKVSILSDVILFVIRILFALKIKFKAPSYVSNIAEKPDLNHTLADWKSTRQQMLKLIENYPEKSFNKIIFNHPILGNMALKHVIEFEITHFNVHKKQILKQL